MSERTYDVIIVGGGPAGLSAALVLGRCRRRVLVCDAGHPRNEHARAMHGFLSRDGIPPAAFAEICRDQLLNYPCVEFRAVKVLEARRQDGGFEACLEDGRTEKSRILLLATGLVDELPKVPGFMRFYGSSVHHCPYCDGWEHRDQPLAVLGNKVQAAELAVELLQWSRNITLCSDGPPDFSQDVRTRLERLQIPIAEQPVQELIGEGDELGGVRFQDGTLLKCSALFFSPGQCQRSPFAEALGCTLGEEDGCILSDANAATNVPGLFAAGNATRGHQLVIIAAAEGTEAAFAINEALIEADTALQAEQQQATEVVPPA